MYVLYIWHVFLYKYLHTKGYAINGSTIYSQEFETSFDQLSLFIDSLYTLMHLEIVTAYMFQHQVHSPVTYKLHTVQYNGVQYAVSL